MLKDTAPIKSAERREPPPCRWCPPLCRNDNSQSCGGVHDRSQNRPYPKVLWCRTSRKNPILHQEGSTEAGFANLHAPRRSFSPLAELENAKIRRCVSPCGLPVKNCKWRIISLHGYAHNRTCRNMTTAIWPKFRMLISATTRSRRFYLASVWTLAVAHSCTTHWSLALEVHSHHIAPGGRVGEESSVQTFARSR